MKRALIGVLSFMMACIPRRYMRQISDDIDMSGRRCSYVQSTHGRAFSLSSNTHTNFVALEQRFVGFRRLNAPALNAVPEKILQTSHAAPTIFFAVKY